MTILCFPVDAGGVFRLKNGLCLAAAFLSLSLMNLAGATNETLAIRLNTVGYLPLAQKQASIAASMHQFHRDSGR